ncbi:MAG: DUF4783 domain-containing protein [Ignavibacteriales bacterium]
MIPGNSYYPQSFNSKGHVKEQKPVGDSPKVIFSKIEEGIALRKVETFAESLGSQTYLSLSNGITGYFSSAHVFYILQDFFRIYKPINFRFLTMNDRTENPYASGSYKFESKGIRGTAQVYISLKLIGNSWKISQITIN